MAHVTEDRVLETGVGVATTAFTLAGAVAGFRTFSSQLATNDTCWYAAWAVDANGTPTGAFENGLGTLTAATTLTRTTVLESSNANAAVTFTGTLYVALSLIAAKTAQFDNVHAMLFAMATAEPPTPPAGMYLYAREIVPGQTILKTKRPSGVDSPIQDGLAFNRVVKYNGGPAVITAYGGGALTAATAGTAVTPTSGTTIRNALPRTQFATGATAGSINSLYANAATIGAHVLRGTIAGEGGFRVVMRFGISATQTGLRFYGGVRDVVTAPTNIDPFTATTPGGIALAANIATSANWRIVHNVSGTAPTNIDLGANFPVNATDLMELVLFVRPFTTTAGNVGYRVRRYTNMGEPAFEASGTISTNLPAGGTLLHPTMWASTGALAAVSWQVNAISIESDF
jgi:hypothetical protein